MTTNANSVMQLARTAGTIPVRDARSLRCAIKQKHGTLTHAAEVYGTHRTELVHVLYWPQAHNCNDRGNPR